LFFFSSRRRHTRFSRDWSSDVCSSDLAAFFQISDGLQVVVLGALRGLQDVKVPTLITFVAYWLIGFPVSYYLGLSTEFKSMGVWIGLLLGLTASAVMLYLRFHYLTKKLIANQVFPNLGTK